MKHTSQPITEKHYLAKLGMTREQIKTKLLSLAKSGAPRPKGDLGKLLEMYTTKEHA